jgi:hypothetical protein
MSYKRVSALCTDLHLATLERRVLLTRQPNVLIEGPAAATEAVLHSLVRAYCREPAGYWGDTLGDRRPQR